MDYGGAVKLIAAESRAGQRNYTDVELAVAHVHGKLGADLHAEQDGRIADS